MPDPSLRAAVLAEIPQLPLAYFEAAAPHADWDAESCGYLQLSAAYGPYADEAERLGWPTVREAADHLAILTRPAIVVERLLQLVEHIASTDA